MGQFRALRLTGRPRCVEDHRGVVLVPLDHVFGERGRGEQRVESAGIDDHRIGLGLPCAGAYLVGEGGPGEQQPGARVAEVVGDLPGLEQGVHRNDDAARPEHAEVGDGEIRAVGQHDRDLVAWFDAAVPEQSGHPGADLVKRAVREDVVPQTQRGVVRVGPGASYDVRREVHDRATLRQVGLRRLRSLSRSSDDRPRRPHARRTPEVIAVEITSWVAACAPWPSPWRHRRP